MALRRKAGKKSSPPPASKTTGGKAPASKTTSRKAATPPPTSRSSALVAQLSDPKTLRRLLLAAKVVGPAVAGGALKASTGVRAALDERKAKQLGVPVDHVAEFKGPTGAVQARIRGLSSAVADLRERRGTDAAVARFTDSATARLGELTAAADATLSMPAGTRRAALHAVSADLDHLDANLMTFLVGPTTG